jgi:hypothetical protein
LSASILAGKHNHENGERAGVGVARVFTHHTVAGAETGAVVIVDLPKILCPPSSKAPKSCTPCGSLSGVKLSKFSTFSRIALDRRRVKRQCCLTTRRCTCCVPERRAALNIAQVTVGMETVATILHADLDAFCASVEQLLDPSLRGKPIAVGGGIVLAASYEAKAFGVRSAMPGRRARELCPQLTLSPATSKSTSGLATQLSRCSMISRPSLSEYPSTRPCRRRWLPHLFGPPPDIASGIRHRIRVELGLPISMGVARTKHLARIASQVAKPDGLVVVDPRTELDFLHDLPVELMWGVGPVTRARLAEIDVHRRTRGLSAFPAAARFGSRRNSTVGRGGSLSGFHPAIALAHCRACPLSVIAGNLRRNSTAAANSPPWSNAVRIAAASSSDTVNICPAWKCWPARAS